MFLPVDLLELPMHLLVQIPVCRVATHPALLREARLLLEHLVLPASELEEPVGEVLGLLRVVVNLVVLPGNALVEPVKNAFECTVWLLAPTGFRFLGRAALVSGGVLRYLRRGVPYLGDFLMFLTIRL